MLVQHESLLTEGLIFALTNGSIAKVNNREESEQPCLQPLLILFGLEMFPSVIVSADGLI